MKDDEHEKRRQKAKGKRTERAPTFAFCPLPFAFRLRLFLPRPPFPYVPSKSPRLRLVYRQERYLGRQEDAGAATSRRPVETAWQASDRAGRRRRGNR